MYFLFGRFHIQWGSFIKFIILFVGSGLFVFSAACQNRANPESVAISPPGEEKQPGENIPVSVASERVSDPDQIQMLWESSPHSDTFVAGDAGKNSDCARCHSPVQWIPTMDDLPSSCFTCKFTVEEPPPVIPVEEWTHVGCDVCHEVKKGVVSREYAWLEIAAIGEYAQLDTTSELCLKCHVGVEVVGHQAIELAGVHIDLTCTHCHDPHSTQASCGASGCHEDVFSSETAGHSEEHRRIACAVCHDGHGLEVGINEEGVWETYKTIEAGGEIITRPAASHEIVRVSSCDRCHYPGNQWGLEGSVE